MDGFIGLEFLKPNQCVVNGIADLNSLHLLLVFSLNSDTRVDSYA